jgi:tetratricopeptide (TPR) repeat protein
MTSAARPAVGVLILLAGAGASAESPADPVEREMTFIDGLADATDLYNEDQYDAALRLFQSLVQSYRDLDTDGYAVLGLADCLAALGRVEEARQTYESAVTPDPHRQEVVRSRLDELQLRGPITDAVLDQLRAGVQNSVNARFASAWRLARAIQKQAAQRLAEAAEAFRTAAEAPGEKPCSSQRLTNHAIYLDELVGDLKFLIDEIEGHLTIPRNIEPSGTPAEPVTQELRLQQTIQMPDAQRVQIEIEQQADAANIKVDGKTIQLTPAERQLIRRHQDRINAILLKAVDQARARRSEAR